MNNKVNKLNLSNDINVAEMIHESQVDITSIDLSQYYIVKIAGKGNIKSNDFRLEQLLSKLDDTLKTIFQLIGKYNAEKKPILIIWDGDNYQDDRHKKPSPFTILIMRMGLMGFTTCAVKYKKKNNPWKKKHTNTWLPLKIDHILFYNDEPHIIVNDLCNMYISYGSTNFRYKDDIKEKGETSGYKQLTEFKEIYDIKELFNDDGYGIEIYIKQPKLSGGKKKRTKKKVNKKKRTKKVNKKK